MPYCLNKGEIDQLIKLKSSSISEEDIDYELNQWIKISSNYTDKITLLNYFFSQLLESYDINLLELKRFIDLLYNLQDQMWIEIQEFDFSFVTYMSRHISKDWKLEDILIEIQSDLSEYKYD